MHIIISRILDHYFSLKIIYTLYTQINTPNQNDFYLLEFVSTHQHGLYNNDPLLTLLLYIDTFYILLVLVILVFSNDETLEISLQEAPIEEVAQSVDLMLVFVGLEGI